jgi:hypothetical protein
MGFVLKDGAADIPVVDQALAICLIADGDRLACEPYRGPWRPGRCAIR